MVTTVRMIWIIATVLNSIALLYSLIGSTAFFNRPTGTEWGFFFIIVGIPAMILIIISIMCLIYGWMPYKIYTQIALIVAIVVVTFLTVSAPFSIPIRIDGWLTERVSTLKHSSSSEIIVQTTEDGKYEYFLEVINSGQKNSRARLFVRNAATGEETRISLDFKNDRIRLRTSHTPYDADRWSFLTSSEISPFIYILTTTENLNDNIEIFEVDMETKTSRRIE